MGFKKFLLCLVVCVLCILNINFEHVNAEEIMNNKLTDDISNFEYKVDPINNMAILASYKGTDENITIPSIIDGYNVLINGDISSLFNDAQKARIKSLAIGSDEDILVINIKSLNTYELIKDFTGLEKIEFNNVMLENIISIDVSDFKLITGCNKLRYIDFSGLELPQELNNGSSDIIDFNNDSKYLIIIDEYNNPNLYNSIKNDYQPYKLLLTFNKNIDSINNNQLMLGKEYYSSKDDIINAFKHDLKIYQPEVMELYEFKGWSIDDMNIVSNEHTFIDLDSDFTKVDEIIIKAIIEFRDNQVIDLGEFIYNQEISNINFKLEPKDKINTIYLESNNSVLEYKFDSNRDNFDIEVQDNIAVGEYIENIKINFKNNSNAYNISLKIKINKADSIVVFKDNIILEKTYDNKEVSLSEDIINKHGSLNTVKFEWYDLNGNKLDKAPVNTGNYKVKAILEADENYNEAMSSLKEFVINKALNTWINEPSIKDWTYGDNANTPSAKAQFGDITFTYSDKVDGTYTDVIPTNAGTYYVKASVLDTDNYSGLEKTLKFNINPLPSKDNEEINIPDIDQDTNLDELVIKDGNKVLEEGVDYTISVDKKGNEVTITIEFMGNYSGTITKSYKVSTNNNNNQIIIPNTSVNNDVGGYVIIVVVIATAIIIFTKKKLSKK